MDRGLLDLKIRAMQMSSDPVPFCSPESPCTGTCNGCPRRINLESLNASLAPNSSGRFDSIRPSVGDLVGQPLGAWLPPKVYGQAGADPSLVFSSFDPMRPTVGDLVGIKAVEAAASCPPVVRRIDGRFDPTQPTVGDLVTKTLHGHTSLRTISIEPGDIAVHPSRVKGCSR